MRTKRHEESPSPLVIFMCVYHFGYVQLMCARQDLKGGRKRSHSEQAVFFFKSFFSFLPFRSLKYSAGRRWWYQQQLTFGRMLRVKSRTNKRKKRIWNANATNYLRNWNYRRLHCFVMTNGEKRGRISWNVCDECWKSRFNYSSAAALVDASMHSRESLFLNVVCLSSSLCSLRYSCVLLPSLPTRPLISRHHRAAKRIPCVHAKTNETRSLKSSSVQGTTEVGGSISQFISNSTVFVIENLNNFIFLWQIARFFSFFFTYRFVWHICGAGQRPKLCVCLPLRI